MSGNYQSKIAQQTIESTPQDLTTGWVDIGDEILMEGYNKIGLWLKLAINDSLNARIRVLAKHESAHADEYSLPIKTVGSSDIKLEDAYYEFNDDADQKVILEIETGGHIKILQIQIQTGTLGASPGTVAIPVATKIWGD